MGSPSDVFTTSWHSAAGPVVPETERVSLKIRTRAGWNAANRNAHTKRRATEERNALFWGTQKAGTLCPKEHNGPERSVLGNATRRKALSYGIQRAGTLCLGEHKRPERSVLGNILGWNANAGIVRNAPLSRWNAWLLLPFLGTHTAERSIQRSICFNQWNAWLLLPFPER